MAASRQTRKHHITRKFKDISYDADDIQLYVSFMPDETDKPTAMNSYLTAIKDWMDNNYLQLNTVKTEVFIVAFDRIAPMVAWRIGTLSSPVQSNLKKTVISDQSMYMSNHSPIHVSSIGFMFRPFKKHLKICYIKTRIRDDHSRFYIIPVRLL